jgi:hypothetical protein
MNVFLEERRTRLSVAVLFVEGVGSSEKVVKEGVESKIEGAPKVPLQHSMGYWLFQDIQPGMQKIIWSSSTYQDGSQTVNVDTLPRLRPIVKITLTKRSN